MKPSTIQERFARRLSSTKNGTTNWPTINAMATQRQFPWSRTTYHGISSLRFAYQIRKYCENAIYAQKMTNANSSLPRSCRCSWVIVLRNQPAACRITTVNVSAASEPTIEPAQKYTPYIVEYQR